MHHFFLFSLFQDFEGSPLPGEEIDAVNTETFGAEVGAGDFDDLELYSKQVDLQAFLHVCFIFWLALNTKMEIGGRGWLETENWRQVEEAGFKQIGGRGWL